MQVIREGSKVLIEADELEFATLAVAVRTQLQHVAAAPLPHIEGMEVDWSDIRGESAARLGAITDAFNEGWGHDIASEYLGDGIIRP